MSNVIDLPVITRLDIEADKVLQGALGKLDEVVVIGYTTEGGEYFASSKADGSNVIWHLERAKHRLMQITDSYSDG